MRKLGVAYKMPGHTDTVTSLRLSPDGSYVLSNSMDNSGMLINRMKYRVYHVCVLYLISKT